jgi:hypothetical protein
LPFVFEKRPIKFGIFGGLRVLIVEQQVGLLKHLVNLVSGSGLQKSHISIIQRGNSKAGRYGNPRKKVDQAENPGELDMLCRNFNFIFNRLNEFRRNF